MHPSLVGVPLHSVRVGLLPFCWNALLGRLFVVDTLQSGSI